MAVAHSYCYKLLTRRVKVDGISVHMLFQRLVTMTLLTVPVRTVGLG